MSKLTKTQLKKILNTMSKEDIEEIIFELYKQSNQVNTFLNLKFNSNNCQEVVSLYKNKIKDCFPLNIYADYRINDGRKLVNEFIKLTTDNLSKLDIMLYYVECGNHYTNEYGDIDSPFYNSLISMYKRFINLLNKSNAEIYNILEKRIHNLYISSANIGWGYGDAITELTNMIIW